MAVNGRVKGAQFELAISKALVEAAGEPYTRKDCYRTPLSGGHPFGDLGDLTISPEFRLVFPFVVECKHYKRWDPSVLFAPRKNELDWGRQVVDAARKSKTGRIPLLVMHGNFGLTIAAAPAKQFKQWYPDITYDSGLYFQMQLDPEVSAVRWLGVPWSSVLHAVEYIASSKLTRDRIAAELKGVRYNKDRRR